MIGSLKDCYGSCLIVGLTLVPGRFYNMSYNDWAMKVRSFVKDDAEGLNSAIPKLMFHI